MHAIVVNRKRNKSWKIGNVIGEMDAVVEMQMILEDYSEGSTDTSHP